MGEPQPLQTRDGCIATSWHRTQNCTVPQNDPIYRPGYGPGMGRVWPVMGLYGSNCVTLGVGNDSLAFERGHSMQMRPRGDISKVAVRDGAANIFENANFHDHT